MLSPRGRLVVALVHGPGVLRARVGSLSLSRVFSVQTGQPVFLLVVCGNESPDASHVGLIRHGEGEDVLQKQRTGHNRMDPFGET
jgi:hypothetical protein